MTLGKNKVLVLREEAPTTVSGTTLIIPDAAKEKPDFGEVLAVGAEVTDWKVGDRVFYPRWSGFSVVVPGDDRDLLVLFMEEIWFAA